MLLVEICPKEEAWQKDCQMGCLHVSAWPKLLCIIVGENAVDECGCKVASALSSFNKYLWNVGEWLGCVLALFDVDKPDWSSHNALWMALAFVDKAAKFEKGCGCVAKGKEHSAAFGIVGKRKADACLGAGDVQGFGHILSARVVYV